MFQAGPSMITIDDSNWQQYVQPPAGQGKGCVPRDYLAAPLGCYFPIYEAEAPLIPESDWQRLLDEQIALGARFPDKLRDVMGPNNSRIASRDQDGEPYCWMHSGVSGLVAQRAIQGLPFEDLSAFGPACKIKNFRSEGGWGVEGCKFLADKGCPTSKTWPQQSKSRANDNVNTWAEAAKYKLSPGLWYEIGTSMKASMVSVLLRGGVVVSDFNWWSHSVLTVALISLNPFVTLIWNSWGDSWSQGGMGQLQGSRAIPDDAVAIFGASAAA